MFYLINHQTSCSLITNPSVTFIPAEAAYSGGQVTWQVIGDRWCMTNDTWLFFSEFPSSSVKPVLLFKKKIQQSYFQTVESVHYILGLVHPLHGQVIGNINLHIDNFMILSSKKLKHLFDPNFSKLSISEFIWFRKNILYKLKIPHTGDTNSLDRCG